MTNLLFGFNNEALNATSSDSSATETGYDVDNLWTVGRDEHWRADTSGVERYVGYQNAGTTVNYLAICRADYHVLGSTNPNFEVEYSADDISWSYWYNGSVLTSADLVGPNEQDFVYYNSTSATDEYWRVNFKSITNIQAEAAAVYLGTAFDMGRDPNVLDIRVIRGGQSNRKARHSISLEYSDIDYDTAIDLLEQVGEIRDYHPIVMFTATNHDVLFNMRMIQCRVVDIATPQKISHKNDITLELEGLL